ncbi:hypothetical protein AAEO56_13685 [Flavobacterium sp. DGU11]|uniref:Uncharacterized protein n=1 Tax=Flavobacterium arundinis TaxID=3139143 RepID=A0ABU9HYU1_9FLAO
MEEIFLAFIEYPGALLHWLLRGMTPSFEDVRKSYFWVNTALSVLIFGIVLWIVS